jgi:hypothetical protein
MILMSGLPPSNEQRATAPHEGTNVFGGSEERRGEETLGNGCRDAL